MNNITKYIESGILELYVLGLTNPQETDEINELMKIYPEVCNEVDLIADALKIYSITNSPLPNASLKAMVLATIDFTERLKNGEQQSFPKILNEQSKIEDYNEWLNREDMFLPTEEDEIYAKIIGFTPQVTTAILWLSDSTPAEIHTKEFEKFLILEGTCDITINDKVYSLIPGNYLSIPLHVSHHVKVTSIKPCKAILQRVAA